MFNNTGIDFPDLPGPYLPSHYLRELAKPFAALVPALKEDLEGFVRSVEQMEERLNGLPAEQEKALNEAWAEGQIEGKLEGEADGRAEWWDHYGDAHEYAERITLRLKDAVEHAEDVALEDFDLLSRVKLILSQNPLPEDKR